jgi:hypothetical protein
MAETSTPKDEIRQALDRGEPKPWLWPEDGDEVIGRALYVEHRQTKFGEAAFFVLDVDGDERSILCGNQVLLGKLKGAHLQPGDWVGVRRLGERESQNGQTYVDFSVKTLATENRELSFAAAKALPESVTDAVVVDEHTYADDDAPPDASW